jgi:hypothetical protein
MFFPQQTKNVLVVLPHLPVSMNVGSYSLKASHKVSMGAVIARKKGENKHIL